MEEENLKRMATIAIGTLLLMGAALAITKTDSTKNLEGIATIENTRQVTPLELMLLPLMKTFDTTITPCYQQGDTYQGLTSHTIPHPDAPQPYCFGGTEVLGITLKQNQELGTANVIYTGCTQCSTFIDYTVNIPPTAQPGPLTLETAIYCSDGFTYDETNRMTLKQENIITVCGDNCQDECTHPECENENTIIACYDVDNDGCKEQVFDQCPPNYYCNSQTGQCEYRQVTCQDNQDCNDGKTCTQDICINPGTDQSTCQNTEKDTDQDGIGDCTDQCPQTPGPSSNNGCPTINCETHSQCNDQKECTEDTCIKPGTPESTCQNTEKDTDEDGIGDCTDQCPDQKGTVDNQGCPEQPTNIPWYAYLVVIIVIILALIVYKKKLKK